MNIVFSFSIEISVERKKVRIQAGHGLRDKALVCGQALCGFIPQTVHPKGIGALEDCPNYTAERLAAAGFAIDRPEGDGINNKGNAPIFLRGFASRLGVRKRINKRQAVKKTNNNLAFGYWLLHEA